MTALGLGTAQLGLPYGISNRGGQPSEAEAEAILRCALDRGVHVVDTAPAYGEAEALLGRLLPAGADIRLVTKTAPLAGAEVRAADVGEVRRSAERSLERLRRDRLDGLLVHHGSDLALPGGERLAEELIGLRDAGIASRIGVSVYDRDEVDIARKLLPLDIVQLPLNVLDQRLLRDGTLAELREEGVEVHARSAFLQGLLLMDPEELPARLAATGEPLRRYHELRRRLGLTPIEAALGFVRDTGAVDVALIGANSAGELEECAPALRGRGAPGLREHPAPSLDYAPFALDDPNLIDPRQWPAP
jgi:aryl-alcohol dehydrogenase-like predicted oxidoreductase